METVETVFRGVPILTRVPHCPTVKTVGYMVAFTTSQRYDMAMALNIAHGFNRGGTVRRWDKNRFNGLVG